MKTKHAKSPCCKASVSRYGNRRRQCKLCKRTWSIRKKKRGRKPRRGDAYLLQKRLVGRQSFSQQLRKNHPSVGALRRRFRKVLERFILQPRKDSLDFSLEYILVVDGLWFRFRRKIWVLYLMAVKPIGENQSVLLDPVLIAGKECASHWRKALKTIPEELRQQIRALVSDGFRGASKIAADNHWILQRCYFHLVAKLQARLGKRKFYSARKLRRKIYHTIRKALIVRKPHLLKQLLFDLRLSANHPECPRRLKQIAHEFLRQYRDYRTYLRYPQYRLPTTTNSIESLGRIVRDTLGWINTAHSLEHWAIAFIRLNPKITCNGHNSSTEFS